MPRQRGDLPARATEGWCLILEDALNRSGLTKRAAAGTKSKSTTSLWRATNPNEANLKTAMRATRRINEISPDANVPDPYVLIESREHAEWIEIGTRLLEADPERFAAVLAAARSQLKSSAALRRLQEADFSADDDES